MSRFKQYLASEIGIEFKACLYFFAILFFYSMYRILQGSFFANIIVMAEMIFSTYIMGYIQVYLLGNFDEAEQLTWREILASVFCSIVYSGISFLGKWYDRNITITVLFFCYILFCYICVYFVYMVKRVVDTAVLNHELENFKKKSNRSDRNMN